MLNVNKSAGRAAAATSTRAVAVDSAIPRIGHEGGATSALPTEQAVDQVRAVLSEISMLAIAMQELSHDIVELPLQNEPRAAQLAWNLGQLATQAGMLADAGAGQLGAAPWKGGVLEWLLPATSAVQGGAQ